MLFRRASKYLRFMSALDVAPALLLSVLTYSLRVGAAVGASVLGAAVGAREGAADVGAGVGAAARLMSALLLHRKQASVRTLTEHTAQATHTPHTASKRAVLCVLCCLCKRVDNNNKNTFPFPLIKTHEPSPFCKHSQPRAGPASGLACPPSGTRRGRIA